MHDDIERRFSSRARSRAQLLSGVEFDGKDATFFLSYNGLQRSHNAIVVCYNEIMYLFGKQTKKDTLKSVPCIKL